MKIKLDNPLRMWYHIITIQRGCNNPLGDCQNKKIKVGREMAKSLQERCDQIVGEKEGADYFTAIARRKEGEETFYAFGVYFTLPGKFKTADAAVNKTLLIAVKRMVSAENSGLPAAIATEKITLADAIATLQSYNGENFLARLNEVRESRVSEPKDTTLSLAKRQLASDLRDNTITADKIASAKVPLPEAPLDKNGKINYSAWVKVMFETEHPWATVYHKKAIADKKKAPAGLD